MGIMSAGIISAIIMVIHVAKIWLQFHVVVDIPALLNLSYFSFKTFLACIPVYIIAKKNKKLRVVSSYQI